jgi:hypothetical protein
MSRHPLVKSAWLSILFLVVALLAACDGELEESRPRVWIAAPLNGSHHELGTIQVMSHSSCKTGISELALLVNGQEYRRRAPDNAGATLITNVQTWDPPAEGQYTLQVVAYTRGGLASEPATVQVTIGAPRGTTPPTVAPATPPPVAPGEPTLTPTTAPPPEGGPTFTPTHTPSSEPPTLTPTSPAPARAPEISYFEAYPATISAGACSDLRWGVEYATAVFLDGQGVVDHDTTRVCPVRTTSYTLVARSGGGERQASVTVTVTEAPTATSVPDTAGPEISDVQRSAGVIYFPYPYPNSPCDRPTEVTITARVTDSSGVARVRLVRRIGSGEPQAKDMTPIGGDLYQATMSGPSQIATIDYLIRAWDTLDNLRDGGRGTIEVQRCD